MHGDFGEGARSGGGVGGDGGGAAELGEEDAGEDEGGAEELAGAEALVEEEERGEGGEDGLEREDERGVGGRQQLLGPALDGEGGGGGEEAVMARARMAVEVRWSVGRPPSGSASSMKTAAKAIWRVPRRRAESCGEACARVSRCAAKAMAQRRVSHSPRCMPERIRCAGAGGAGEEDQAGEGEDGSEEDDGVGLGGCWRGDAREQAEEGDEDDDEAGEEGGLRRRGVGEAGGLEAVAEREEETGGEAEAELGRVRPRSAVKLMSSSTSAARVMRRRLKRSGETSLSADLTSGKVLPQTRTTPMRRMWARRLRLECERMKGSS